MINKNQAPTPQGGARATGSNFIVYKGTKIFLSETETKCYNLLCGGKMSSYQLMQTLKTSDPRTMIKRMRAKGIDIGDYWIERTEEYPRYKMYFIIPPQVQNDPNNGKIRARVEKFVEQPLFPEEAAPEYQPQAPQHYE